MGRLLATTALLLAASVTAGCSTCMQSGYYDPCGGVCYGPSVKTPSFLSGLKKNKHNEHSCPLCTSDAQPTPYGTPGVPFVNNGSAACSQHGHGNSYPTPANYGAAFGQPVSGHNGGSPSCACPSPQSCAAGCSGYKRSQAWRGKGSSGCNCSSHNSNCNGCDTCQHQFPISTCDACSTIGDSYSGVVYDEPFITDSYSSEPMILPGETIIDSGTTFPETFSSSGNCPHCQSTNGPIFQGNIVPGHEQMPTPGYETDKPAGPTPAPAAEPTTESAPGETVAPTPAPEPLPASTTMMIPTFPAPKPARQVHWVPNTLK
ncbi:MAG: hypothetical protein ACKVHE_09635 [Planctomycetales bacterium]|jgi:hypothetical protein